MSKITLNEMNDNLIKWKNICGLMGCSKDISTIDEIINIINENKELDINQKKEVHNKNSSLEEVRDIIVAYNEENEYKLKEKKLSFVKINVDLTKEWMKLTEKRKEGFSKKELNVIYNIFYKPKEINYMTKNKSAIVEDINFFINNKKRNEALKQSNLI